MADTKNYIIIDKMITTNQMHKKAIETAVDDIGMNRSRHRLLMNLARQGKFRSQKEIADHLEITQAAVTVSLSKLERDGLIERSCGEDNRFNEISITEKGREIVEKSRAHFAAIDEVCFDGFSDSELDCFGKMLDRIRQNLKKYAERTEN